MIKTTAIVLIVSGFVLAGQFMSSYQKKKADVLSEIVMMISFMQNRLRYDCLPVTSLLKAMSESGKINGLVFVDDCIEKTESGMAFSAAWHRSIEDNKSLCRLICNATDYLIRFGYDLGTTDLDGQLSCCEYYQSVFCRELNEKNEHNKKYLRIYPALGATLGIWAAILII